HVGHEAAVGLGEVVGHGAGTQAELGGGRIIQGPSGCCRESAGLGAGHRSFVMCKNNGQMDQQIEMIVRYWVVTFTTNLWVTC
ncbi:MAG TPA: hypothetical protein PKD38_20380, partial [Nitrospira sp.]|nr:hypothetical protein [Nitrospira sp.]